MRDHVRLNTVFKVAKNPNLGCFVPKSGFMYCLPASLDWRSFSNAVKSAPDTSRHARRESLEISQAVNQLESIGV